MSTFAKSHDQLPMVGSLTTTDQQKLTIFKGVADDIRDQIITKSTEEAIKDRCPKDSAKRFVDKQAFANWYAKRRTLYSAVSESGEVGGIIWFGPEPFDGEAYRSTAKPELLSLGERMSDTYAIRTYESIKPAPEADGRQRGSGIAKTFTQLTTLDYVGDRIFGDQVNDYPVFSGIHLETDLDNVAARSTYENLGGAGLGYIVIGESPAKNRVAMALPRSLLHGVLDRGLQGDGSTYFGLENL